MMMDYIYTKSSHPELFADDNEAVSGLKHRDFVHQLELLSDPKTTRPNQIKSLTILKEVLSGQQEMAEIQKATEILRPFLYSEHHGLVLHSLACLNSLIIIEPTAQNLVQDIPKIFEYLSPDEETPIREEAVHLLQTISEFVGAVPEFLSSRVVKQLVDSVSFRFSSSKFLYHAFRLLSRLTNQQTIRVPLIESSDFLMILVRTFSNVETRQAALICASNIAMDPSNKGKLALINAGMLLNISALLESNDDEIRYSVLSLISLLAVPKEGKHKIVTDRELPDVINRIARNDRNESCRKAANEIKILVSELPLGKAIMGDQK